MARRDDLLALTPFERTLTKGGISFRPIKVNDAVLDTHFGVQKQATVVSQSVPPGTTVVRGAAIDVTMAVTGTLPVDIFENVPATWTAIPIQDVANKVRQNQPVLQLLATHDDASSLTEAQKGQFQTFLRDNGLATDALDQAFEVARNAHLIAGE
jgi:hypothetical protein